MGQHALVAHVWHQRTSAIETRERLLATLAPARDRLVLTTCHRVEVYAVADACDVVARELAFYGAATTVVRTGEDALAHLIAVAAGLDSDIAGEPQILAQVRAAYRGQRPLHPLLVAAFERALHSGRALRHELGLRSARSVGSLAVDEVVARAGGHASVLVIGAGEMGHLAVRALSSRVRRVIVANRDPSRADALAAAYGARAISLGGVRSALAEADAVISAADTRGAVLDRDMLAERLATERPLLVVDLAVPRSVASQARELLGPSYLCVDDLPGARSRMSDQSLSFALGRCAGEARAFFRERAPERVAAIVALRRDAEAIRETKVRRAMARLAHLSDADRRAIETLSTALTNALIHRDTVALREPARVTDLVQRS